MKNTYYKKAKTKTILLTIIHALGTFLFVFLMMHSIIMNTMGIYNLRWQIPHLSLPAYFVCITIGIKYWIGKDIVRLWSYLVSTIFSAVVLFLGAVFTIPTYVSMPLLKEALSVLILIGLVLYAILKTRIRKKKYQLSIANREIPREKRNRVMEIARVICILSICCVLFENWQSSVMFTYGFITGLSLSIMLSTFSPFPLAILSAILLARFMKAEFVQWKPSPDGETK